LLLLLLLLLRWWKRCWLLALSLLLGLVVLLRRRPFSLAGGATLSYTGLSCFEYSSSPAPAVAAAAINPLSIKLNRARVTLSASSGVGLLGARSPRDVLCRRPPVGNLERESVCSTAAIAI
jgi:hypothetical protein